MNKIILIALLLLASGVIMAQSGYETVDVALSDPGKEGMLKLHIHSGNITVVGESRSDIELGFKRRGDEGRDKSRGGLKRISGTAVDLDITEYRNEVEIDAGHESTNYMIRVPVNFSLSLSTHHQADVVVKNVVGEIEVQSHHGGIELHEVGGSVLAETHHGGILVTMVSVDESKPMAFSTYHGDVEVSLPASVNCSTKINPGRGEIFTDFEIDINPNKHERKTTSGGKQQIKVGGWVQGEIGSGGKEYMFTTYHGDVVLRKR